MKVKLKKKAMNKCHIGTSGWNYESWKKKFYNDAPSSMWLEKYAQVFRTVEVNNTFYRWPRQNVLENWFKRTPDNFTFTFKVPRSISHRKEPDSQQIKDFYKLTGTMGKKTGCFLFQFPPRFNFNHENFTILQNTVKAMDSEKDNAIELREKNWWNKKTYDLLTEHNIGFVSVQGLGMPQDILATADFAYVRLHGTHYDTKYSMEELKEIALGIKKLKVNRTYAYFDNDQNAYAPENASQLRTLLGDKQTEKQTRLE